MLSNERVKNSSVVWWSGRVSGGRWWVMVGLVGTGCMNEVTVVCWIDG